MIDGKATNDQDLGMCCLQYGYFMQSGILGKA